MYTRTILVFVVILLALTLLGHLQHAYAASAETEQADRMEPVQMQRGTLYVRSGHSPQQQPVQSAQSQPETIVTPPLTPPEPTPQSPLPSAASRQQTDNKEGGGGTALMQEPQDAEINSEAPAEVAVTEQDWAVHHRMHADPLIEQLKTEIKHLHHRLHEHEDEKHKRTPFEQEMYQALDKVLQRVKAKEQIAKLMKEQQAQLRILKQTLLVSEDARQPHLHKAAVNLLVLLTDSGRLSEGAHAAHIKTAQADARNLQQLLTQTNAPETKAEGKEHVQPVRRAKKMDEHSSEQEQPTSQQQPRQSREQRRVSPQEPYVHSEEGSNLHSDEYAPVASGWAKLSDFACKKWQAMKRAWQPPRLIHD